MMLLIWRLSCLINMWRKRVSDLNSYYIVFEYESEAETKTGSVIFGSENTINKDLIEEFKKSMMEKYPFNNLFIINIIKLEERVESVHTN